MEHKGTVSLETGRLILRRFTPEDTDAFFKNWGSDERVTEFLRWETYSDIEDARRIMGEWVEKYDDTAVYHWAIVLRDLGEPIGSISAWLNEKPETVHIGYCIGSRWWHRGITSEALDALIPFFFNEVKANRIESQHDPRNPHSGGVMKKCGMRYEGTLRQADRSNKGIVDACVYAILREDFLSENK
ncbi:MAG: GNAT family N-acetyltransferase [Oscillospiraceae bacterium]|nr:GNAT family N-acetyltransferase [Oscillospiraceae bacterium]